MQVPRQRRMAWDRADLATGTMLESAWVTAPPGCRPSGAAGRGRAAQVERSPAVAVRQVEVDLAPQLDRFAGAQAREVHECKERDQPGANPPLVADGYEQFLGLPPVDHHLRIDDSLGGLRPGQRLG